MISWMKEIFKRKPEPQFSIFEFAATVFGDGFSQGWQAGYRKAEQDRIEMEVAIQEFDARFGAPEGDA